MTIIIEAILASSSGFDCFLDLNEQTIDEAKRSSGHLANRLIKSSFTIASLPSHLEELGNVNLIFLVAECALYLSKNNIKNTKIEYASKKLFGSVDIIEKFYLTNLCVSAALKTYLGIPFLMIHVVSLALKVNRLLDYPLGSTIFNRKELKNKIT